jgi:hypothetical protein
MSVLSAATGQQLEETLISSGMITPDKLAEGRTGARKAREPLISYLVKNNYISDEQLTKANAGIT